MKENQEYIRKRRPINFTLPDLEADSSDVGHDENFEVDVQPSTSRALPNRGCKKKIVYYDDSRSSDSDEETEQLNLIESTKNSIQDEENVVTVENENGADYYYEENSYEDSDPYGYGAEMLGQHFTSSDDDY